MVAYVEPMPDTPQPITPLLVCGDIPAAHDFLVDAFGFAPGGVTRTPDGDPVHGEISIGGMTIWLHRASAEHKLSPASALPVQSGGLAIIVADVDAHHDHARAAGATIQAPPADMPYGRREYSARDPEGHRWWFGTPTT
jgi:uncharacterized glyoxalase superfamily protein PhnB